MRLAVATQNLDAVPETYVRQHMRLIAPNATVAIALGSDSVPPIDLPVFNRKLPPRGLFRKLHTLGTLVRTGYAAALSRAGEAKLEEFLTEHNVSAVLAEFGPTGCALRNLCNRLGLPLVVNFHGHDATVLGRRLPMRLAYGLLAKDATRIVCGSQHFAGIVETLGFPRDKIEVIPCGIEIEGFEANAEKDRDLVIAVGRLTRKKRPDLAIRAFARAHRERPTLRMEIIGEGDQRHACEAVIQELHLGEVVTLLGVRSHSEVKTRLARAGIFVQHSITAENGDQESQGISLLEAMASGLPVIATDHNGFSETVVHGRTGLLSPEFDTEKMGRHLLDVARDAGMADSLGVAGRRRVEEKYAALYLASRMRALIGQAVLEAQDGHGFGPELRT